MIRQKAANSGRKRQLQLMNLTSSAFSTSLAINNLMFRAQLDDTSFLFKLSIHVGSDVGGEPCSVTHNTKTICSLNL